VTIPILISLAFAVLATLASPPRSLANRLSVAAATGFALAALDGAGGSVVSAPRDGIGYLAATSGVLAISVFVAGVCARVAVAAAAARR
jgi:hypothetical protein